MKTLSVWRNRLITFAASRSCPSTSPTTSANERVRDLDHVIPVSTDLNTLSSRTIACRNIPTVDTRNRIRQQTALELMRDTSFAIVGVGSTHHGSDLFGELFGQAEISLGKAPSGTGRYQRHGPEQLVVRGSERNRHIGGELEELEKMEVCFIPAGRSEKVIGHVCRPHG